MCKVQMLRALVEQRLTAAAEEIFGLFERTIAEYEEELCRSKEENERQRELLDAVFNPQLRVHRAVDANSVECRQGPEPPPHIKEEQEELWSSQEEGRMYRHIDQIPFTLVSGASEYGDCEEETVQPAGRRSLRTAASSTQTPALPPDNKSQIVIKEEQQECSCSVDQQEPEPPPHIKEEQEEPWSSQEEGRMYRHIDQIPFTLVSRASEYGDYEEDVEQLMVVEEEIPPEQQDCSSSVDQEESEAPPHIKEEQEDLWGSQEGEQLQGLEEADITKFPFTPVPVKSEDDEEEAQSSQLHQRQTQHMETEAYGEDGGGPEPARNSRPHPLLQPETEEQTGDSSEPETNDSADWKETREPQSALNSLKHRSIVKKRFSCLECGRRFVHKQHLKRHLITHTGEKPFRCSQCGKAFTESFFLKIHMKTHYEQKHFSCLECGKAFPDWRNLKNHMMTHSGGEKPFSCSVCKKSFTRRGRLRSHMVVHTGEKRSPKPFSCSDCGNRFGTKAHLKRHMRTHTGEKPFSCSECGKAFSDNGNLKKHLMTHTGEKPFSCSVCNRRFAQRIHLKTHKCVGSMETETDEEDCGGPEQARNSHPLLQPETGDLQPETEDLQPETEDQIGDSSEPDTEDSADWKETREPQSDLNSLKHDLRCKKTFSCSECGKRFGCKAHLRRHAEIHREKRFSCKFCNERFAWRAQFQEHKCVGRQTEENKEPEPPSHPHPLLQPETLNSVKQDSGCKKTFICSECGRRFGNKGTLRRHIMTHTGEKPFSCSVCEKSFTQKGTLQKHIMIHTEEKSYSCPVCNTSFIQRGNLQQHMVVHMRERIQPPCL